MSLNGHDGVGKEQERAPGSTSTSSADTATLLGRALAGADHDSGSRALSRSARARSTYFQEIEIEADGNAGEDSDGQSPVFGFRQETEDIDEMSGGEGGLSVPGGGGAEEDPEFPDDDLSSVEVWCEACAR